MRSTNSSFFQKIKYLISGVPAFEDEEKAQRAFFLQSLFNTVAIIWILGLVMFPSVDTAESLTQLTALQLMVALILIVVRWFMLWGRISAAGLLFTLLMWLALAIFSLVGTGLTGIVYIMLLALSPFIAGFSHGTRASVVVTILNGAIGYWLAYQEWRGVLPIGSDYDPFLRQTSYVIMFAALPFLVYVWKRSIDFSIEQTSKASRAEEERVRFKDQADLLEKAVAERTQQLSLAKEEAEKSSNAKSVFLATMSHEMRSPLNAIIGYSELLYEIAEDGNDPESAEDLLKIQGASRHLLSLIANVLDLSKIESSHVEVFAEEIIFDDLVTEISSITSSSIKLRNNRFSIENKASIFSIHTDYIKLKQILINLVTNASKFTENGQITLTISQSAPAENNGALLIFKVSDNGIGIPQEKLQSIFQPFEQVDSSFARKQDGSGLGLAISKEYAELLGGDLTVESQVGVGSNFILSLPMITKPHLANKKEPAPN